MNTHEEYGQGFVDGFNAALQSDYIKTLYQTQDKEQYIKRINKLEGQLNKIITFLNNPTQICNIQQVTATQSQAHFNLAMLINDLT